MEFGIFCAAPVGPRPFQSAQALEPLVERDKKAIAKPEPVSEVVHDRFLTIAPLICLEDGDEARLWNSRRGDATTAHLSVHFDTIPAVAERLAKEPRPIPQTRLRELVREAMLDPAVAPAFPVDEQDPEKRIASGLCVGNPDEVRRAVKKYEDVGVDVLGMIPRTSWIEPQELVLRSLATTGREVLPAFRPASSAASH